MYSSIENDPIFERAERLALKAYVKSGSLAGANAFLFHFQREHPEDTPSLWGEIADELREAAERGVSKFKTGMCQAAVRLRNQH